jgi:hypothetical protein
MEKEFIPYEQALALKELGFDEDCIGYYFYNGSFNKWTLNIDKEQSEYLKTISAPTFSQVFRWFREKYKISGEISSDYYLEGKDNEWEYNIYQLGKEDDGYVGTIPIFKTPEEAELECLKKLISIIKEK